MVVYDKDLLDFWISLINNNVEFLMVGGFAVNMHGYTRATKDVDIWIKDNLQNRINLGKSLAYLGYMSLD
jgi:hypothetical protein